jgi:hypothetical protein
MNNTVATVEPTMIIESTDSLAVLANQEHALALRAGGEMVQHALNAGAYLNAAKAQVEHGEWLPWVAAHCDFGRQTATDYMNLATANIPSTLGISPSDPEIIRIEDFPSIRKALRAITPPKPDPILPDEPDDEPELVPPKKGWLGAKTTKTDAIRHMRGIEQTLSVLTPSDVVPGAKPLIREFAVRLIEWANQWATTDADASEAEGEPQL